MNDLQKWLKMAALYMAVIVVVAGVVVLVGWQYDIDFFKSPLPNLSVMNPTAAAMFIMAGISLLLLISNKQKYYVTVSRVLALAVAGIAVMRLLEIITHRSVGADRLLYLNKLVEHVPGSFSSNMAPSIAFDFLFSAVSLLLLSWANTKARRTANITATVVLAGGMFALLGYFYQVKEFYGLLPFLPMSIHSAWCFVLFSLALISFNSTEGFMQTFTSETIGGKLARRLVPAMIFVPVLLGFIRLWIYWNWSLSVEFGVAAMITSIVLIMLILIWYSSMLLRISDEERAAAANESKELNKNLEQRVIERTEKLSVSEKQYRDTLDNMLEGVQIIDFNWRYVYANEALAKQSHYRKEELIGYTLLEKYKGIENTPLFSALKKCMTERIPLHLENEFTFADGSTNCFELSIQPVPQGIFLLSVDITERRKLEQQQILFASIVNYSHDAIASKTLDGIITSWNPGAEKIFGYTASEITGKHISTIIPHHLHNEEDVIIQKIKNGESLERYETERIRKDGKIIEVSLTVSPVRNATGKIIGASKIARDITEKKKAEREILKLNRLYQLISQINQSIVFIKDQQGLLDNACQVAFNIGKFKMAWVGMLDTANKTITMVSHSGIPDEQVKLFDKAPYQINGPQDYVCRTDTPYLCNDMPNNMEPESWKPFARQHEIKSCMVLPIKKWGKTIGTFNLYSTELNFFDAEEEKALVEIAGDLSFALENFEQEKLRKEGEQKIEQSETKLKDAQALARVGSFEIDMINNVLHWSDEMFHILEVNRGQAEPSNELFLSMAHPEDAAFVNENFIRTFETFENSSSNFRLMLKDGAVKHVYCEWKFEFNKHHKPTRIYGIVQDVTERVLAEKKLKQTERQHGALIENITDAIVLLDENAQIIYQSPSAQRISGFSLEDTKNKPVLEFIHPDDLQSSKAAFEKVAALVGVPHTIQFRIKHKLGHYIWLEGTLNNLLHDESVNAYILNYRDVSERKMAEEVITKSEARLIEAQQVAKVGSWETDLSDMSVRWSAETFRIFELNPKDFDNSHINFLDFVHPDDRTNVDNALKNSFNKYSICTVEHRIVTPGGWVKYVQERWRILRNVQNQAVYAVGTCQDITDRVETEQEINSLNEKLIAANTQLSTTLNTLPANIALLDNTGTIISVNKAWEQFAIDNNMQGTTYGVGDNYITVCQKATGAEEKNAREMAEGLKQVLTGKDSAASLEYPCHSAHEKRWFRAEVRPFAEKGLTGAVVMHVNITARKLAEEAIVEMNSQLEVRVNERTHELQAANKELEAFSYTVSHDLQSPLRTMSGFSKILVKDYSEVLDADGQKMLGMVDTGAKRMSELIHDLLHFSRLGKAPLQKGEVDMMHLVEEVIDEVKLATPGLNTEIKLEKLNPAVCDPALIRQVWANLIGNAVKYSAKKDNPVVEIGMMLLNGEKTYFVKDNGAGFDMKYANKLFSVFQRLHSTEDFEGTGVGLATVQKLIIKHGGKIWAEAEEGKGAAFYFTLSNGHTPVSTN